MSANNDALTLYALNRVLFHLGEDQQWRFPSLNRTALELGQYESGRAAARVIVKRRIAATENNASGLWQEAKDAE